ncbi:hypothetical protein BGY98DRAFT_180141 [Russula aff. rugulosa BPL654]|nr:hypothetical protein BGY98DRAFT_180141 [Russula aff. rugulosa BPL654]
MATPDVSLVPLFNLTFTLLGAGYPLSFILDFFSSFLGQLNTQLTTSLTTRLIHVTHPTRMRQYFIVSQIHLILSVINFALAAPLVIREKHEVRVDVVDAAKDGTAASQVLTRWGPRGTPSESNGNDWTDGSSSPESSDQPGPGPHSPWLGSESDHNRSPRPSSPTSTESPSGSLLESTHVYSPLGWGGVMVSHDGITDGDQLLLLPNWDHSPAHQTPTAVSSGSTSSGHAMPPWLLDDPPPESSPKASPSILSSTGSDYSRSSDTHSSSTSSGSAESDPSYTSRPHDPSPSNSGGQAPTDDTATSLSTGRYPQSPGQTDNHPPPGPPSNPSPSTGPQQSADSVSSTSPGPQSPSEPKTFLSKLLKGKLPRRTFGSGTGSTRAVNPTPRELQGTLDSRASTMNGFGKSLDVLAPLQ